MAPVRIEKVQRPREKAREDLRQEQHNVPRKDTGPHKHREESSEGEQLCVQVAKSVVSYRGREVGAAASYLAAEERGGEYNASEEKQLS